MSANVKSAIRVLEVLEYFDSIQGPASVSEISRALGYPLSSTSMLLQSLSERGYLEQDAHRCYFPTARVTLLGTWIAPRLTPDGDAVRMMEEFGEKTGQTIVLAMPSKVIVRYVYVVQSTLTLRMHIAPGSTRPLATSGFGRLFLSTMPDDEIRRIVFSHNMRQETGALPLSWASVRRDMQAIRADGYSVSLDRITPGVGVVAMPLPGPAGTTPMAVGVGGPSQFIRSRVAELAAMLRNGIRRHIEIGK